MYSKTTPRYEEPIDLMSVRLRILFVCESSRPCARFQSHLEREGCQLLVAANAEKAVRSVLSAGYALDAVLLHDDDLARGSTIALLVKRIRPAMPVFLLTATWPSTGALPMGVDALGYAPTLTRRVAHDISGFVRRLLLDNSPHATGESIHRLLPRAPTYLN